MKDFKFNDRGTTFEYYPEKNKLYVNQRLVHFDIYILYPDKEAFEYLETHHVETPSTLVYYEFIRPMELRITDDGEAKITIALH